MRIVIWVIRINRSTRTRSCSEGEYRVQQDGGQGFKNKNTQQVGHYIDHTNINHGWSIKIKEISLGGWWGQFFEL